MLSCHLNSVIGIIIIFSFFLFGSCQDILYVVIKSHLRIYIYIYIIVTFGDHADPFNILKT